MSQRECCEIVESPLGQQSDKEKGVIPLRGRISLVFWVFVVVVGIVWLRSGKSLTSPTPQPSVAVSNWGSGIGAVNLNSTTFAKQNLSFWASVANNTNHTVYVRSVKVILPDALQRHVLTGTALIIVNKRLAQNATYKIRGHFILDTAGMTKEQIITLGNIKGFTVNTKS